MSNPGSITQFIPGARLGDSVAEQQLWERYFERLVRLARQRLVGTPRRVSDEEDVALSVFDSFLLGARKKRFPRLEDRDDLWQVLLMITARKAANERKKQRRLKRGGGKVRGDSVFLEEDAQQDWEIVGTIIGREPTPEFVDVVAKESIARLGALGDQTLHCVAVWKLQGYTNAEIAEKLDCKLRTVERKLKLIRDLWSEER